MHVTGKILVFVFLPVAAIAALVLSARLVDVRGTWMGQLQAAKQQNETTTAQLAEARIANDQAREELQREMLRWNQFWPEVRGQFVPQNKSIVVDAGTAAGLEQNKMLYAFELADDGSVTYVGNFVVDQPQANQSALKPAFRVRDEDIPKWTSQRWRLREIIPSASAARITDLEKELLVADELLAKQQSNLDTQAKLVETAKEQREVRLSELLGGKNAPGLAAQIRQADEGRNSSLTEVDRLRRAISASLAKIRRLIEENKELAKSLPGQAPPRQAASSLPRS
jgi:hypothetical protein